MQYHPSLMFELNWKTAPNCTEESKCSCNTGTEVRCHVSSRTERYPWNWSGQFYIPLFCLENKKVYSSSAVLAISLRNVDLLILGSVCASDRHHFWLRKCTQGNLLKIGSMCWEAQLKALSSTFLISFLAFCPCPPLKPRHKIRLLLHLSQTFWVSCCQLILFRVYLTHFKKKAQWRIYFVQPFTIKLYFRKGTKLSADF